jgi:hypothetical protein
VRLAPQNAAVLFALVKAKGLPNTKVVLTGTAPPTAVARRGQPTRAEAAARPQRQDTREAHGYPSTYPQGYYYYPQRPAYAQPPRGYYGQGYYDPRYQRRYPYGE